MRRQAVAPAASDDIIEQDAVVNEVEEVENVNTSVDNEADAEISS